MSIPDIEIDDERVNRRIERKSSSEIEEKANPSRAIYIFRTPYTRSAINKPLYKRFFSTVARDKIRILSYRILSWNLYVSFLDSPSRERELFVSRSLSPSRKRIIRLFFCLSRKRITRLSLFLEKDELLVSPSPSFSRKTNVSSLPLPFSWERRIIRLSLSLFLKRDEFLVSPSLSPSQEKELLVSSSPFLSRKRITRLSLYLSLSKKKITLFSLFLSLKRDKLLVSPSSSPSREKNFSFLPLPLSQERWISRLSLSLFFEKENFLSLPLSLPL